MSLRIHLDRYCQLRAMSHERISPTRRSRSPTRASSSAMGSSSLQHPPNRTPPTTPHRPVIFQLDLKPMQQLAVRNPYYNILTPKVAGNLSTATYDSLFQTFKVIYPGLCSQSFRFRPQNRGHRHAATTMVDPPTSVRLLHDDWHRSRSSDAWRPPSFSPGRFELVLPDMENSSTSRCLHDSWVLTFDADTPSRSTGHRLCCPCSSDSPRASIRHGHQIH